MNLKKDAMMAVSLAGAVLVIAGISSIVGSGPQGAFFDETAPKAYDKEILDLFSRKASLEREPSSKTVEKHLDSLRDRGLNIYRSRPLQGPIDLFRLGSILETSTDPAELELAHRLAAQALTSGIDQARDTVLKTQDRLLLSIGQPQRYGTQPEWRGERLQSFGVVSPEVSPSVRFRFQIGRPRAIQSVAAE